MKHTSMLVSFNEDLSSMIALIDYSLHAMVSKKVLEQTDDETMLPISHAAMFLQDERSYHQQNL